MYAIIEDGSHQYKVEEGMTIDIQRHDLDESQDTLAFDHVLMLNDDADVKIGQPYVDGAKVTAKIEGELKGDKITIVKFRRRKNYRRKQGHRQRYLRVRIEKIEA